MNPELQSIAADEFAATHDTLNTTDGEVHLFNQMPYERTAVVEHQGKTRQVQLPALGTTPFSEGRESGSCHADRHQLSNGRLSAEFNDDGYLTRLTVDDSELLLDDVPHFAISPDNPAQFDAWDIDHHTVCMTDRIDNPVVATGRAAQRTRGDARQSTNPIRRGKSIRGPLSHRGVSSLSAFRVGGSNGTSHIVCSVSWSQPDIVGDGQDSAVRSVQSIVHNRPVPKGTRRCGRYQPVDGERYH